MSVKSAEHITAGVFRPHSELYRDANERRQFDFIYAAMLIFGSLIALLGLLLNSPAVIIGAMLISPLMGPLLACGLSLALADWHIGIKAGRNLALSIVETIAIAAIATWLSPLQAVTPEIAARTNPNVMDLLIALFSGTAGTLALSSRRQAFTILPGVAIATAVAPPLATVGYALSTKQSDIARGAALLFVTNMTAIILSAAVVFTMVGFRMREHLATKPPRLVRFRLPIAALLLIGLAVPLVQTLTKAVQQTQLVRSARTAFETISREELHSSPSSLSVAIHEDRTSIRAILPTREYIPPDKISSLETELEKRLGRKVELHIEQVQLAVRPQQAGRSHDYVAAGAIKKEDGSDTSGGLPNARTQIESRMCEALQKGPVSKCDINSVEIDHAGLVHLFLTLQATHPLSPELLAYAVGFAFRDPSTPVVCNASIELAVAPVQIEFANGALTPSTRQNLARLKPYLQSQGVTPVFTGHELRPEQTKEIAKLLATSPTTFQRRPKDERLTTVSLVQSIETGPMQEPRK